jgi:two-component system, NarL family, sensor histidine kinase DesK
MKIYPKKQIKHYLIDDANSLVFPFFIVLETESVLGVPLRLALLAILAVLLKRWNSSMTD